MERTTPGDNPAHKQYRLPGASREVHARLSGPAINDARMDAHMILIILRVAYGERPPPHAVEPSHESSHPVRNLTLRTARRIAYRHGAHALAVGRLWPRVALPVVMDWLHQSLLLLLVTLLRHRLLRRLLLHLLLSLDGVDSLLGVPRNLDRLLIAHLVVVLRRLGTVPLEA